MRYFFFSLAAFLFTGDLFSQILLPDDIRQNRIHSNQKITIYPTLGDTMLMKSVYDTSGRTIEMVNENHVPHRKAFVRRDLFIYNDRGQFVCSMSYLNDTLTDSTVILSGYPHYATRTYLHGKLTGFSQMSGDSLHIHDVRATIEGTDTTQFIRDIFTAYGANGKQTKRTVIEIYARSQRRDTVSFEETVFIDDFHSRSYDRFDNSGYGNVENIYDTSTHSSTIIFYSPKGKMTKKEVLLSDIAGNVVEENWYNKKNKLVSTYKIQYDTSGKVQSSGSPGKKHTERSCKYNEKGLITEEKYMDGDKIDALVIYTYTYY